MGFPFIFQQQSRFSGKSKKPDGFVEWENIYRTVKYFSGMNLKVE